MTAPEGWNDMQRRAPDEPALNPAAPKMKPIPAPVDTGMTIEVIRHKQQEVREMLLSAQGFGTSVAPAVMLLTSAVAVQAELIDDLIKKMTVARYGPR